MQQTAPKDRRIAELSFLFDLCRILEQSLDMREVADPILQAMASELGLRHGTLTLLNRKTGDILIEAAYGLSPKQARKGRYRLGEGVTGQVILNGEPMVVEKVSESPIFLDKTERQDSDVETSFVCVPIKTEKEVVGALSIDRDHDDEHDAHDDLRLLTIVASLIAQAVKLRRSAQEERDKLERENQRLRAELKDRFRPSNIIGNSREMKEVYEQLAQVARSQATVLINGETGTGKELVAHAIHYNSDRADKPFVKAHCAALPENLIESELFGHVKGAFTGAVADRKGRFQLADGGTLFLDEIGEIPVAIQIKLLRVLQEREFEPVGSTETVKVNVRLIAATHRDLREMVSLGTFREDLYYRLNVFGVYVPPLRKRKSDVLQLADHFLERYARENGKDLRRLSSPAIDMIYAYHWPGNVRELENAIERAVIVAEGDTVHAHNLPPTLQTADTAPAAGSPDSLAELVAGYERDLITDALKSSRGNMAAAARMLQTTQRIFGYKVKKYGVDPKRYT